MSAHRNRLVEWWHRGGREGGVHWHFWPYPKRHTHPPKWRSCDGTHG